MVNARTAEGRFQADDKTIIKPVIEQKKTNNTIKHKMYGSSKKAYKKNIHIVFSVIMRLF